MSKQQRNRPEEQSDQPSDNKWLNLGAMVIAILWIIVIPVLYIVFFYTPHVP